MKYILMIIVSGLICWPAYAGTISLSEEQFEHVDAIDSALRSKYAQYKGMNGSRESLEVIGLSAQAANSEISKMDFSAIASDKEDTIRDMELVKGKLVDMAIADLEASGKTFKNKQKLKDRLTREGV